MRLLWRLISGLPRLIWRAFRTVWLTVMVLVLVMSVAVNVSVFSTGAIATAIVAAVEFVTGTATVLSQLKGKTAEAVTLERKATATALKLQKEQAARTVAEADLGKAKKLASKWEGTAVGRSLAVGQIEAEKAAIRTELTATRKLVSKWEGTALAHGLTAKRYKSELSAAKSEVVKLTAARRVVYEGVEMSVQEAITRATSKIKMRTVKLATADLSATAAQAIPWLGIAAVVAATGFDLKMSCDTMKDMHAIELAVNPGQVDDPNVDLVCGLQVPTEEEVWEAIKASPGAAWDAAKKVLDGLPSMPEMPEFDWSGLPEIGMPNVQDIDWTFWK